MNKISNTILKKVTGFTLVEMTVVLVIMGLLLAGLLVPLREGIKQERRVKTEESLKTIEEALYGFAITNGRLPCPDCRNAGVGSCNLVAVGNLNDGTEDLIPGPAGTQQCAADPTPAVLGNGNQGVLPIEGNLPWVTLGVGEFDEWESWFTYSVMDYVADFVGTGTPGNLNPISVPVNCPLNSTENLATIDMCPVGNITIQDGTVCVAPFVPVAQDVFAVVVSHGENVTRTLNPGTGLIDTPTPAFLCNEAENSDSDGIFILSNYINPGPAVSPGGAVAGGISQLGIDDQIIWISPQVLKSKLVQAGRLP